MVKANFGNTCSISVHIGGLNLSGPDGVFSPPVDQADSCNQNLMPWNIKIL